MKTIFENIKTVMPTGKGDKLTGQHIIMIKIKDSVMMDEPSMVNIGPLRFVIYKDLAYLDFLVEQSKLTSFSDLDDEFANDFLRTIGTKFLIQENRVDRPEDRHWIHDKSMFKHFMSSGDNSAYFAPEHYHVAMWDNTIIMPSHQVEVQEVSESHLNTIQALYGAGHDKHSVVELSKLIYSIDLDKNFGLKRHLQRTTFVHKKLPDTPFPLNFKGD